MRARCAVAALSGLLSAQVGRAQQPPAAPEPQAQSVSGTVTSSVTGLPLPSVNVRIKGTNQRTASNAAGRYTLNVPSLQDTLHFSDRKSTRLNSSHLVISYAVFCLKKKTTRHST